MTATALTSAYLAGTTDPVAETERALAAAAEPAARHAFIALTPDRAREEAAASRERYRAGRPLGPLDGVTVSWKDLFDLAGTPTTAGSPTRRAVAPAAADAPIVARLAAAGMVSVGKTNLTEFAFSGLGVNPGFGTPVNPFSTDVPRIPGGSSSGAAVSVALGIAAVGMGTDTSGSIRIPASFNGLVGYRPSNRRYPATGVFPLSEQLDTPGPIARTVADILLVDAAIMGTPLPAQAPPPALVVPDGILFDGMAPDVARVFEEGVRRLERSGIPVHRRRVAAIEEAYRLAVEHGTLVAVDAYRLHRALLESPEAALMDPRVRQRVALGANIATETYVLLQRERARLIALVAEDLGGAALLYPTVAHTAPPLEPLEREDELFFKTNGRTLRNTMLGSFLDLPGLSLPAGTGDHGLPVGLLVSMASRRDEALLGWGEAAERLLAE